MHQWSSTNLVVESGKVSGLGYELLVGGHLHHARKQSLLKALKASRLRGLDGEDSGKWPI
jgi:hypothetical protein